MSHPLTFRYTHKPIHVTAVQYTEAIRDAFVFDGVPLPDGICIPRRSIHPPSRHVWSADAIVDTPDGYKLLEFGEWVVTDDKGRHSVCKSDEFESTYDAAA